MSDTPIGELRQRVEDALDAGGPLSAQRGELDRLFPLLASRNEFGLNVLRDLSCTQHEPGEFTVHYRLLNPETGERLGLEVTLEEDRPWLPTCTGYWPSARVPEREILDLFGLTFDGHPDPRRLFLDEQANYFPLRKDFELSPVSSFPHREAGPE